MKGAIAFFSLLGLLVLLSWAPETQGLKCYTCTRKADKKCPNPPVECTAPNNKYCQLLKNNKDELIGSCQYNCTKDAMKCCAKDGCNSVSAIRPALSSLMISFSLVIFIRYV